MAGLLTLTILCIGVLCEGYCPDADVIGQGQREQEGPAIRQPYYPRVTFLIKKRAKVAVNDHYDGTVATPTGLLLKAPLRLIHCICLARLQSTVFPYENYFSLHPFEGELFDGGIIRGVGVIPRGLP